jgi:prepilin peptidase CpaA
MPVIVLLFVVLVIASIVDLRAHRIPNWLTYPAALVAIGVHTLSKGFSGFLFGIEGLALGFGLFILFYLAGGMGAGDVKLMATVGAFLGPKGVLVASIFTALVGGIYSVGLLVKSRRVGTTVARFGTLFTGSSGADRCVNLVPAVEEKSPKLCYGVAIALGTIVSIFLKGHVW